MKFWTVYQASALSNISCHCCTQFDWEIQSATDLLSNISCHCHWSHSVALSIRKTNSLPSPRTRFDFMHFNQHSLLITFCSHQSITDELFIYRPSRSPPGPSHFHHWTIVWRAGISSVQLHLSMRTKSTHVLPTCWLAGWLTGCQTDWWMDGWTELNKWSAILENN